jgi:formate hydrogenlyase subunit 4
MVPFGKYPGFISFEGDFLFVAYLMALGRILSILAALDTGSAFQGMGANREAILSWLAEPAFFIVFASLGMASGTTSLAAIFYGVHEGTQAGFALAVLAMLVLFQTMMVESSRFPVNDPRTHLELTMIHEVMILDHSGFDLALIQTGAALKFATYAGLIAALFVPLFSSPLAGLALSGGLQVALAGLVGFQESFRARNRLNRNPQMVLTLSALAILVFFAVLIVLNKFSL